MSRELTQKEFHLWQERLRYADDVWKDAGLHDESEPEKHLKRWFDYYRGDQADGIGFRGIDASLGVIDNVFFSTINALVASVFARNPRVDVVAERPDRKPNAEKMERVVNHLVASPRLRMKREINRALLDATIGPFSVIRHGFTAPREKTDAQGNLLEAYDAIRPEFPWIRRQAPWDFRSDPLAETLHPEHATWCAFRDLYSMDTIRKSPAFIARDDLRPTRSIADEKFRRRQRMEQSPDEVDLVEVWTVYDKTRREMFRLSPGCNTKAISKVREWPIAWRTLPYSLLQFNPMPDDPMGVAYGAQIGPLQDDLNRAYTLAMELAKRQRRIIFVSDQLDEEEKNKLEALSLMEFIFTADVAGVAREMQVGGNFQELLLLIQQIKNEIRALVGVSEMERGQRINVETASEAAQVGQGAALQRGRNQGPFEDFLADVIETFARGVQETASEPLVVPILGAESAQQLFEGAEGVSYAQIEPEQIQGEFQYRIRPGSTLPHDPNEELRREVALNGILAAFGEIVNMPQRAIDTLLAAEKDPAKQLMNGEQLMALMRQRAQGQLAAGAMGGEAQPPAQPQPQGGAVDPALATLLAGGGGRGGVQ